MRLTRNLVLVLCALILNACAAGALDFGGALRRGAGQILNNAIQGAVTPTPQHQPQPQQQYVQSVPDSGSGYTSDYQKYMEGSSVAESESTTESETTADAQSEYDAGDSLAAEEIEELNDNPFGDIHAAQADTPDVSPAADETNDNPFADINGGNAGDGDGAEGTIEVVATGIGTSSDSALKNALRAAVEQAVGTLVDSETFAQNDEIMDDKILSYSAGFVESHTVMGEPRTEDGLVTIRVKAQVKKTQLTQKLKSENISVKSVDGESLFGEAITKLDEKQSANDIVLKAFEGFPHNLLEAKLSGKPEFDADTKKIRLSIALSVNQDAYTAFTDNLLKTLTSVAGKKQRHSFPLKLDSNGGIVIQEDSSEFFHKYSNNTKNEPGIIFAARRINDARTNSIWESVEIETQSIINILNKIVDNIPNLIVDVVDKDGIPIVSENRPIPFPFFSNEIGSNWSGWKKIEGNMNHSILSIFPVLNTQYYVDPYTGKDSVRAYASGGIRGIWPGTKSIDIPFEFDVSPEEIKEMRNVKCVIE